MPEMSIKIKGLEQLRKSIRKFPEISAKYLQKAIKYSLMEIERETIPKTPVSEGRLRSSFRTALQPLRGVFGPTAKYGIFVHEGTRPHWPSFGEGTPLNRWARLHGIEPFLVARAISRRGTKAKPFLKEGIKDALPKINFRFEKALEEIIKETAKKAK